ncbi:FAD-dependent oxidoreductase [Natronosalvus rutilus]|uniref:FAD-dependent oxidoreductase n=1 Tax=Natronosalvus rutilus TaxID=2953753 RepID=A0A9E7NBN6_9EURY|nr:FAD-dependent oxidoreductase [Natronosalvus rutilus]UTF53975.1 FAD-dependent oxidoreductase [Natronosalvus rutilus]
MVEPPPFHDDETLPGEPTSPWLTTTPDATYPALEGNATADVCIVGAGITGLSTAYELRERGHSVIVLERDRIASGVTGKSTAKVTSQHGLCYDHLRREFGRETARTYAGVNEAAIDTVESRVEELDIDCGFERQPSYCYGDDPDEFRREADAARQVGLPASFVKSVPPFERAAAAVKFDDQAWFHPRKYLLGLASALETEDGVRIHERTRVTDVSPGNQPRVETEGGTVRAKQVVLATGFPLLDRVGFFTRLYPKRSYVLGVRLEDEPPEGMYYRDDDPYRSVRTYCDDDETLLLVGGENHKTGQGGSTADRYRRLAHWTREHFPVASIEYRWSTQDYVSVDSVPFVGPAGPGAKHVLVATGFGGWGMTNGTAAGQLLAETIAGDAPTPRALETFDPLRFTPKPSLPKTLTENADAASQFVTDWARTLLSPAVASIESGEGRVLRRGPKPVAAARDDEGDLHAVSAVCTHTYCVVDWNDAECTWDCPCHGSRFSPDGTLLEGPATEDLEPTSRDLE